MEAINFYKYYNNQLFSPCKNNVCTYNISNNRSSNMTEDLKEAIEIIKKLINCFDDNKKAYALLLSLTNNDDDIKIIEDIMAEEIKHNKILRNIYYELTGKKIADTRASMYKDNLLNYKKNLQKSLERELHELRWYKKVMAAMPDRTKSLAIMDIITNKLKHANLYNYLLLKNI